jgi:hypothetical protein
MSSDSRRPLADDGTPAEPGVAQLCRWCRRPVEQSGRGRPRLYCKRSCRQRDFESRTKSSAHGLDEQQIIVARAELDELRDRLYVLQCALDDVDRDFPDGFQAATKHDLAEAVGWLLAAATPLRGPAMRG